MKILKIIPKLIEGALSTIPAGLSPERLSSPSETGLRSALVLALPAELLRGTMPACPRDVRLQACRNRRQLILGQFIKIFFILYGCLIPLAFAEPEKEIFIDFEGRPQRVTYNLYLPDPGSLNPRGRDFPRPEKLPVLVCVGGLPMEGDKYIQSDTRECMDPNFQRFAQENQIAILGLGFLFIPEDWPKKASYQHPQVWSGRALLEILALLAKTEPINPEEVYLFGISAGAQFSARFALMRPDIVKAVAAHAAGGFDFPPTYIPTKFLITVGRYDNKEITRVEWAKAFKRAARSKGIDVTFKIIPKIAHVQTEGQNEMSREFFKNILRQKNNHGYLKNGMLF